MLVLTPTEHGQARVPKEGTNIHHLPAELLHMICFYLKPTEVAGIRLLDRTVAAVGLEYLVAQIHLIPKADSFDRLLAVAEHLTTNRYVTSLFYEADLLISRHLPRIDREKWEKGIVGPEFAGQLEEVQDPYFTSACDLLPHRCIRGSPASLKMRHQYTKQEIQQAFEMYRSYRAEQRRMMNSVVYEEALVRAMKRLPSLKTLIISCNRGNTNHFRAAFQPGFSEDVAPNPCMGDWIGGPQLALLLSAADKAGLQITKLVCGSLGQSFLNRCIERHDAVKRSVRHLRSLHLFLAHIPEASNPNAIFNPLGTAAKPSYSAQLASAASDLEILSIRYDENRRVAPPDLKHFVMDFCWSRLVSATFAKMSTDPETLIEFCGRHARTLKAFSLTDITLHSGRWASTLFEMRQRLELTKMEFAGVIRSHGGPYWDLTPANYTTKMMIQRYVLHKDRSPRDLSFHQYVAYYKEYLIDRDKLCQLFKKPTNT